MEGTFYSEWNIRPPLISLTLCKMINWLTSPLYLTAEGYQFLLTAVGHYNMRSGYVKIMSTRITHTIWSNVAGNIHGQIFLSEPTKIMCCESIIIMMQYHQKSMILQINVDGILSGETRLQPTHSHRQNKMLLPGAGHFG